MRTSPATMASVAEMGSGVLNVGMRGISWGGSGGHWTQPVKRLADAAAARARRSAPSSAAPRRADEPRVDGQPLAGGGLLDAGLEGLGEAKVDARHRALVVLGRRGRRGGVSRLSAAGERDDELRLAAAQAQLGRAGRELAGDLVSGGRQRLEQGEADRRVAAVLTGGGELAAKAFDVRGQVHGTSMASLWHFSSTKVTPNWRSAEERGAAPPRGTRHEHAAAEQHDGRGGADSGVVPLEAGG